MNRTLAIGAGVAALLAFITSSQHGGQYRALNRLG